MGMGIDEAGHDDGIFSINDLRTVRRCGIRLFVWAKICNSTIHDIDTDIVEGGLCFNHGQNRAAFNNEIRTIALRSAVCLAILL